MNKVKKLVIVGDGEFAQIAFEYFTYDSTYEVVAFAVEQEYHKQTSLCGLPVVELESIDTLFPATTHECYRCLDCAGGDGKWQIENGGFFDTSPQPSPRSRRRGSRNVSLGIDSFVAGAG